MSKESTDSLRARIDPAKKARLDKAFDDQKISQQDGVISLVDFFLSLDDVGRALMLGQIRPAAEDIANLLLRRLHQLNGEESALRDAKQAAIDRENNRNQKTSAGTVESRRRRPA